jgi:phosphoenolpyruvate synthase/pyruvate phosphate dikinase
VLSVEIRRTLEGIAIPEDLAAAIARTLARLDEQAAYAVRSSAIAGGREARDAIRGYLHAYGMRCVGEIDVTRPRWSERPTTLVPLILGNIKNFEPGAGERRFEQGRQEAWKKEQEPRASLGKPCAVVPSPR